MLPCANCGTSTEYPELRKNAKYCHKEVCAKCLHLVNLADRDNYRRRLRNEWQNKK